MDTVLEGPALDPAVYRALTEHATDLVVILEADGTVRYASPSCRRLLGYQPADLQGTSAFKYVHPDDVGRMRAAFDAAMQADDGVPVRVQCRCRHADGSWRVMATTGSSHMADPTIHGFIASGHDVTDQVTRDLTARVRAEEQLQEAEAQYRNIFESSIDGLIIGDMDGRIIEANPAACRMYGYTHDEIVSLNDTDLIHPDSTHLIAAFNQAIGADRTFQAPLVNLRKDGTSFHVEVLGTGFMHQGRPHVLSVLRDITERVRARELLEQRVAERTHELSTLLEVSHNVASTLELQPLLGLILDQLKAVVEYTGAGIAVQDGTTVRIIAYRGPDTDERPLGPLPVTQVGALWQWMRQDEPVNIPDVRADTAAARIYRETVGDAVYSYLSHIRSWMAVPMRVKDRDVGSLFLEHSVPDHYTAHHADLAHALAQQAAIAMENARLYEQAQALAVLEERQRLARELHDSVSQALYGIALGVQTARLRLERNPARVSESLDYILELAQAGLAEMRALIFELLPEGLATEGLVNALRKQVAALQARHEITIDASLCGEPAVSVAVKEAIYRIAQEALHNTVKHAQALKLEVRLEEGPSELVVVIRDDGQGFDTGGAFPGHLGLLTMRERATKLGGILEVESAVGVGTSVRARIPSHAAG